MHAPSQALKLFKTVMVPHLMSSLFQRGLIQNPVFTSPSIPGPNAHTHARGASKSCDPVLSQTGLVILRMAHPLNRRQGLVGRRVFQKEVARIWKK